VTVIFVSPTEPKPLRDIGVVTPYSEQYGCDVYWIARDLKYGIQRKEFPGDFLASVHDGRLGEQINKGQSLDMMFLILEGRPNWTSTGKLIKWNGGKRWPWDKQKHRRFLATVQSRGVKVQWTDGLYDTIEAVNDLVGWSEKAEHLSLDKRVGPIKDKYGRRSNRAWQTHFLQGLPGVGPKQAAAIIDTIGFPFELRVNTESLQAVPGIGKKRAEAITKVFEGHIR
jgi:ERCC4-type nuclease